MSAFLMTVLGACDLAMDEAPTLQQRPVPQTPTRIQDPRVDKAIVVARATDKEAALKEVGMSVDDFDALMVEIAQDPSLSQAFLAPR